MKWKLIAISDDPISRIEDTTPVPQGEIGELIVQGSVVTDRYITRTDANADHKIADGETFWHRMGDVGYFDESGRFWFCGRKSHRLETKDGPMFTVPCEAIINTHPSIYRSALVASGKPRNQTPVVFAEPWPGEYDDAEEDRKYLISELQELALKHWQTNRIQHFEIVEKLPVDIRHNSKIFREKMRTLANQIVERKRQL
jgi:acyl-coenzyme A synthetase/AMP-(fatty) acid ligase